MLTGRRRLTPRALLIALAVGLCLPAVATAGSDYSGKAFGVRLAPAFVRFTEVSALGGETVANRYSPAINPASADWTEIPNKIGVALTPYYSLIHFRNGTNLHLTGESATWDSRKFGTFQPTVSQIRSNEETMRNGLDFDYKVDTFQIQWGKRINNFAVGAMFNYAKAKVIQDGRIWVKSGLFPVPLPTNVRSEGNAESYRFRVGGLYEPVEKLLFGMIVEYGFQPFRSDVMVTTFGIPDFPAGITTRTKEKGIQQQWLVRPGVSYEYADRSSVYFDYAYGGYFLPTDSLASHRFSLGVDHALLPFLNLRATGSVDTRGNFGATCGASVFFSEWASLEFGYQYNLLPELRPEFGPAHIFQFALAFRN